MSKAATLEDVCERLAALEARFDSFAPREPAREFYSIEEVATMFGKTAYTVREWARLHRINAVKTDRKTGQHAAWEIPAHEIRRIRERGLLPLPKQPEPASAPNGQSPPAAGRRSKGKG
jgi:hypothetical protein